MMVGLNAYLKSNKEKVLKDISILNSASIHFNEAHIDLYKDFPNASLILHNCTIKDSLVDQEYATILQVEEVKIELFIKEWREKIFEVKGFHATNGNLLLYRDKSGAYNFNNLLNQFSEKKKSENFKQNKFLDDLQIHSNQFELHLQDFSFQLTDSVRTSNIQAQAHSLFSKINIKEDSATADVVFDMTVPELCFKRSNGSFIKNSHVLGKTKATFKDNKVAINPFDLLINKQEFLFAANIATDQSPSEIYLTNKKTQLNEVLPLLTPSISQTIEPYKILNPFESKTKILLTPNLPAKVTVDFKLDENDLLLKDISFKNTSLEGRFINRHFDRNSALVHQQGSIRLFLKNIETEKNGFSVKMDSALILSDPIHKGRIETKLSVTGSANKLSEWLENTDYIFENGHFELTADIKGPLNDKNKLLLGSNADVVLHDLSFLFKNSDTAIPIESLIIQKNIGDAQFEMYGTTLLAGHQYQMTGDIQNINTLLLNLKQSAESKVAFSASHLAWEDFINLFSRRSIYASETNKSEKETKKSMKQTLKGLYHKVHPSAMISIDTFSYYDLISMFNVHSGIQFLDENHLILEKTGFDLDQGTVDFQAKLDISAPYESVFDIKLNGNNINLEQILPQLDFFQLGFLSGWSAYPNHFDFSISLQGVLDDVNGLQANSATGTLEFKSLLYDELNGSIDFKPNLKGGTNTVVELEGNPQIFNDIFRNDKYFFQDTGSFHIEFEYNGPIGSFDHLIDQGQIELSITDGAVLYKEADIIFPLNNLSLQLHEDHADFILFMYSSILDRELNMSGEIKNFSELVIGNTGKKITTFVDIFSPKIDVVHAQEIFETPQDSLEESEIEIDDKLKTLINGMTGRFNPQIEMTIDTFTIIEDLILHQLNTRATIKDSTIFALEETTFNFFDSTFELDGLFDLSSLDEAPFELNLVSRHLDIAQLMELMNYFDNPSLQNASKIEGSTEVNIVLSGNLLDMALDESKTKAAIDFYIKDLILNDVDIIEEMAPKILSKRAPIYNKITLEGTKMNIPMMEIQSTAIDFFVEGYFDYKDETNIWLSIPLDNLKRKPTQVVPEKRGYAATKNKIYFEITRTEENKLKRKLRVNKKKFYEQRGIPEQFKLDKKKYKQIRKNNKNKTKS